MVRNIRTPHESLFRCHLFFYVEDNAADNRRKKKQCEVDWRQNVSCNYFYLFQHVMEMIMATKKSFGF